SPPDAVSRIRDAVRDAVRCSSSPRRRPLDPGRAEERARLALAPDSRRRGTRFLFNCSARGRSHVAGAAFSMISATACTTYTEWLAATSSSVEPARSDIICWAGGGIILSSVVSRYQLGLLRQAGSLIVPPRACPYPLIRCPLTPTPVCRHSRGRQLAG